MRGELDPKIQAFLDRYPRLCAEVSPSGKGIHIYIPGPKPEWLVRCRLGLAEVYDQARCMTYTGQFLPGREEMTEAPDGFWEDVVETFLPDKDKTAAQQDRGSVYKRTFEEFERAARARHARRGVSPRRWGPAESALKDELWSDWLDEGEPLTDEEHLDYVRWHSIDGPDFRTVCEEQGDDSKIDLKMANIIARSTDDPGQIERVMRMTAREREKWDSPRGNETWLEQTIKEALRTTEQCRSPREDHEWQCDRALRKSEEQGNPAPLFDAASSAARLKAADPEAFGRFMANVKNSAKDFGLQVSALNEAIKGAQVASKRECAARRELSRQVKVENLEADGTPTIEVTPEVRDYYPHLLNGMRRINENEVRFVVDLNGRPTRVREDDGALQPMTKEMIFAEMAHNFRFRRRKKVADPATGAETWTTEFVDPTEPAVKMYAGDSGTGLPTVEQVSKVPIIDLDTGDIFTGGYEPKSRTLVRVDPGLGYEVVENPTQDDAVTALRFIDGEILFDFPLVDQSDRANALGYSLTCSVAPSWGDRNVPIFVSNAHQHGTGKTKLPDCAGARILGLDSAITSLKDGATHGEFDKVVFANARSGKLVTIIDNLHSVASPTLAAMVTSGRYCEGRVLGSSDTVRVRANLPKAVTGNNLALDSDLQRRCVLIRQDAKCANPGERSGFRHANLEEWVGRNQGRVLSALHTAIRAWICAGRPKVCDVAFGSFEGWTEIIGNVLAFAGIEGFLGNRHELIEQDEERTTLEQLLRILRSMYGGEPFAARDVLHDPALVLDLDSVVESDELKSSKRLSGLFRRVMGRRVYLDGQEVWLDKAGADTSANVTRWIVRSEDS